MSSPGFRPSMTALHTWVGLLLGWVCYAIFVTGTASYYRPEITRWMRPELTMSSDPYAAANTAVAALERIAPETDRWFIDLPDERSAELKVYWRPAEGGRFRNETIDPVTGEAVVARDSRGGEFFYRFHFQLMMPHPWGRYTAGVAAMVMFLALITGIIAHRRFFADLFLFRPHRAVTRAWLDFHNAAGVLTLPFFLMITFSGLVIFNGLYLPWTDQALKAAAPTTPVEAKAPAEAPTAGVTRAAIGPMIAEAERRWGTDVPLKGLGANGLGKPEARIELTRATGKAISFRDREQLIFDGTTGELLEAKAIGANDGPAQATHGWLYGIHMGRYASPFLRGLLATSGVLGSALIASGLIMWTEKRRARLAKASRGAKVGFFLVERLNLAAIAGLPFAMAIFFWSNRLLPLELPNRGDWEAHIFLYAWGASLLYALIRPAWRPILLLTAALYILLPVLDALTNGPRLLAAGHNLDAAYLGISLLFVAVGVFLALAAGKVRAHAAKANESLAQPAPARSAAQPQPVNVG